jgi:hypothetical protein
MPYVNFRKKIRFFSFDFRQNFDVRTFPRYHKHEIFESGFFTQIRGLWLGDSGTGEKN